MPTPLHVLDWPKDSTEALARLTFWWTVNYALLVGWTPQDLVFVVGHAAPPKGSC
jgi:hypothetical protein